MLGLGVLAAGFETMVHGGLQAGRGTPLACLDARMVASLR
jgi:hypothetical protein